MYNSLIFGKLKTKMIEITDAHNNEMEKTEADGALLYLYKTFSVWLEDPQARDVTAHMPNMAVRFNPKKLALVVSGDRVRKYNS